MTGPEQGLILEACIGITFGNAGRFDLVSGLRSGRVVIGRRALQEITRAPARDAVDAAVDAGEILVEAIDLSDAREQAALAQFDAGARSRGVGTPRFWRWPRAVGTS